jgi:release factor glutamine methyltransferase
MSTSIAEAILQGAHSLRKAGVPEARREAGSLLAHVIGQDRTFIISHAEDPISAEKLTEFQRALESRAAGKPLQYITGHQEFFGLDFEVTTDVLIPRPETELLVETAVELISKQDGALAICDVGTGSGCVAIAILVELQRLRHCTDARAVAIDISEAALAVAQRNAERHSVTALVSFVLSDCFTALNQGTKPKAGDSNREHFDLIVSNPPYIASGAMSGLQREVRDFEPRLALEAGADGLAVIGRLLVEASAFLKPSGHFVFEIGFDQNEAVGQLIDPDIWKLLGIYNDLQGIPRIVALEKLAESDPKL